MKRLIIIGAGGFGREVANWADAAAGDAWRVGGFLDDNRDVLNGFASYPPILAGPTDYAPAADDVFVCAIGKPRTKQKCCERLLERGARFVNVIHPTALIGRNVSLGDGVILCPRVTLTCDLRIGSFVSINCHSAVGHDATVGDWCQINSFCDVTGFVQMGERVLLGSHSTLLPNAKVGNDVIIGAGSVVVGTVAPGQTLFGAPAKRLRP